MSELSLQRDLIDSIIAVGGHAFKASNRFKVGVADVYAKLPGVPACWLEAKKSAMPLRSDYVLIDLTVPQRRFLMDEHRAGGLAGVASFIVKPGKLWLANVPVYEIPENCRIPVVWHLRVNNRRSELAAMVRWFCEGRKNQC